MLAGFDRCCNRREACIRSRSAASGRLPLDRRGFRFTAFLQIVERCLHAAPAMRNARGGESHFHPGERSAQHQIVEPAKMPYAEDFAPEFAETLSQRQI